MKSFRLTHLTAAILLFTMALIAFINVLSRYLLHLSFAATEEITINLFVWLTVLGIALAFEQNAHLGMCFLYKRFPGRIKKYILI